MAFDELGRGMDAALPKVRRLVAAMVPRLLSSNRVADVVISTFAGVWLTGGEVGYRVHGTYLGAPAAVKPERTRAWQRAALAHGELVLERFRVLAGERELTLESAGRWAKAAGEATLWRGQDDVADDLAHLEGVAWKEFVRAWPREDRREHSVLEGSIIPLDDLWTLPNGARIRYPRDWERLPDPGEWINCGHAVRYHREVTRDMLGRTLRGVGTIYSPPSTMLTAAPPPEPPQKPSFSDLAELKVATESALASLTEEERAAIAAYTGSTYARVNSHLRRLPGKAPPSPWELEAIPRISAGLAKLPGYEGETWRGIGFNDPEQLEAVVGKLKPGSVFTDAAFMSTSLHESEARGFASYEYRVLMRVRGRSGGYLVPISKHPSEGEVLFDKSTPFRVVSLEWVGEKYIKLELEEL